MPFGTKMIVVQKPRLYPAERWIFFQLFSREDSLFVASVVCGDQISIRYTVTVFKKETELNPESTSLKQATAFYLVIKHMFQLPGLISLFQYEEG